MDVLTVFTLAATLAIPGRTAATPSIATRGSLVVVVFSAADSGGKADIFAAVSRDGGATFDRPVQVNDAPGSARVNGEQPPRVDFSGSDIVVVWTTKGPAGTRLAQARSSNGGRAFTRATVVPGTDARGNRGWESIAGPLALWLDHRELADADSAAASQHVHAGGEAMTDKSKLYIGSLDGSLPPHAIAGGVCYCCKTALIAAGSTVYAAWRHVFPGSVRDIAFAISRDGGRTFAPPIRVSDDDWVLQGCPENGPALAVDAERRVHVVWPTLINGRDSPEGNLALFYAQSADATRFTPRRALPTHGTPRHPQLVTLPGGLAAAWDEGEGGQRRVVVARARLADRGEPAFTREVVGNGVYPAIAAGDSLVIAWTAADGIRVQRATPASATSR